MDFGEQTTGTRDEHYNLISVLYHALHSAENCETYVLDAEAAGDDRLAAFFRETQAAQMETAERAKELLGIVEGAAPDAPGEPMAGAASPETGDPLDTEPVDVRGRVAPEVGLPPESEGVPGSTPRDVPPPASVQREPNIPTDEAGISAEEELPTTAIPRTAGTVPLPDEDLIAETRGETPEDAADETSPERPIGEVPREAPSREEIPGEPGRATRKRQTAEEP
ncbi:MAG: hypothetical protein M3272_05485 [Actinomycetota bacterium]|nr:hypothetical protein [Actinomycetota bacterium]